MPLVTNLRKAELHITHKGGKPVVLGPARSKTATVKVATITPEIQACVRAGYVKVEDGRKDNGGDRSKKAKDVQKESAPGSDPKDA